MTLSSCSNISELSSLNFTKTEKDKLGKFRHPLLRPFITFWRFSCYYVELKARSRGY